MAARKKAEAAPSAGADEFNTPAVLKVMEALTGVMAGTGMTVAQVQGMVASTREDPGHVVNRLLSKGWIYQQDGSFRAAQDSAGMWVRDTGNAPQATHQAQGAPPQVVQAVPPPPPAAPPPAQPKRTPVQAAPPVVEQPRLPAMPPPPEKAEDLPWSEPAGSTDDRGEVLELTTWMKSVCAKLDRLVELQEKVFTLFESGATTPQKAAESTEPEDVVEEPAQADPSPIVAPVAAQAPTWPIQVPQGVPPPPAQQVQAPAQPPPFDPRSAAFALPQQVQQANSWQPPAQGYQPPPGAPPLPQANALPPQFAPQPQQAPQQQFQPQAPQQWQGQPPQQFAPNGQPANPNGYPPQFQPQQAQNGQSYPQQWGPPPQR